MGMYRMMSPNNMMYRNRMGMRDNQMSRNMGRDLYMNNDMSSQMVNRNMMSQDMPNNMMSSRNMMSNNMRNNQMMGQDMMYQGMNRMNSYANNELIGQNRNMMSQRMEIEQIPSTRSFKTIILIFSAEHRR